MDYDRLIDAETWAFIRRTDSYYPPETATFPILRQRQIYDAMCRAFFMGYPPGMQVHDVAVSGVPCRHYAGAAERPTVIYFHGGGFVVGGLDSHDDICAEICAATGLGVIAVDYRLAPEHLHPAAFDDAMAVVAALPGPKLLVGDSAGGNLSAAVAHARRGDAAILGQVLIYPGLGGDSDRGSYLAHAEAPMLTRADVLFYKGIRCVGGVAPVADATYAPLHDTDFTGLPPTVAVAAECDPISDDARDYVARLLAAGGSARLIEEPGLVHGYLRARSTVTRARDSFARILAKISRLAG